MQLGRLLRLLALQVLDLLPQPLVLAVHRQQLPLLLGQLVVLLADLTVLVLHFFSQPAHLLRLALQVALRVAQLFRKLAYASFYFFRHLLFKLRYFFRVLLHRFSVHFQDLLGHLLLHFFDLLLQHLVLHRLFRHIFVLNLLL